MLDIKKINNSVVVVSDSNIFYPNDNTNSYPLNSLMVVVDESDMAIFKSASNGDVLFSALIDDLTINGSKTSKDTIFNDLDGVISNAATGGGGGGGSVDAYTKAESDAKYGTKAEQESLRGDVENALGEIAALGYDKADKKDVPTLQDGEIGTENNYIYADMSDYTKRVVADMYFQSDKDDVRLMFTPWGAEGPGPDYMIQMDILPEANESKAGIISADTYTEFKNKQDKLTAGDGITIEDNVISAAGGGDVDLSNYPTKQEVNQTYLQKEGEYVKSVSANGGAINFEKGNGTPDVVNLKTVGGQSIIGMDDIPVGGKVYKINKEFPRVLPTLTNSFDGQSYYVDFETNIDLSNLKHGDFIEDSSGVRIMFTATGYSKQLAAIKVLYDRLQLCLFVVENATRGTLRIKTSDRVIVDGSRQYEDKDTLLLTGKYAKKIISTVNKVETLPSIWFGTETEYNALGTYDDNTLYLLREDDGYLTI